MSTTSSLRKVVTIAFLVHLPLIAIYQPIGALFPLLFIALVLVWLLPFLNQRSAQAVDPNASSFELKPTKDPQWTQLNVVGAKGQPPIGGPLFFGLALAPVFGVGLIIGPMMYLGTRSNYRRLCHQGNHLEIGALGIRLPGGLHLRPADIVHLVARNPVLGASAGGPVYLTSPVGVVGTGPLGIATALGASVGATFANAAHVSMAANQSAFAPVAWMLDALTTTGKRVPLAGGMTEETLTAVVHAIQQATSPIV